MIERKFIAEKIRELEVESFVMKNVGGKGHSRVEVKKIPLGEKIIVYSARPGMVVGRKGENIRGLTITLKNKFKMENPQVEVGEIGNPLLDASTVADKIAYTLERFGPKRFKFLGYDTLRAILEAGAMGAEIVISGSGVPSSRARTWRFKGGYLKKTGYVSNYVVQKAQTIAKLKKATVGIKVSILLPGTELPDKIEIKEQEEVQQEKPKKAKGARKVKQEENGDNKKE